MNSGRENMQAFIRRLTTAAANAALYNLEHRQVLHLCNLALSHLQCALDKQSELSLLLVDGQLIFDNLPLESNLSIEQFVQGLKRRRIETLKFLEGISIKEIRELVALLTRGPQGAVEVISNKHLRYGQLEVRNAEERVENTEKNSSQMRNQSPSLAEIEQEELAEFTNFYQTANKKRQLNVASISNIVNGFIDAFIRNADPLLALAPLRGLDEYTYTHSTNVCLLNLAQARLLGIEGETLHEIGIAAMLHDIGKLFVPVEILQKPGKLDDKEWAMIQEHPRKGAEYLFSTPGIPRLAVVTAFEHHMRYDSSGYPKVSRSWQQHLVSQMTTISDFYDALRTKRSYSASLSLDTITGIMLKKTGTILHPSLTHNFLNAIGQLDKLPPAAK